MAITINFGEGNTVSLPKGNADNIREIIEDPNIEAVLGYDSESVEIRIDGEIKDINDPLQDNVTIELMRKAGDKSVN